MIAGVGDESERYDPSKYDAVPIFPTSGISIRMTPVFIPSRVLMPAVVVMTNACLQPDGAILVLFILIHDCEFGGGFLDKVVKTGINSRKRQSAMASMSPFDSNRRVYHKVACHSPSSIILSNPCSTERGLGLRATHGLNKASACTTGCLLYNYCTTNP